MTRLAELAGLSVETVRQTLYGGRDPSPATVRALSDALRVDVRTVSEWAGQARSVVESYRPPQEADLLTKRERKAINELIRAITATRGERHEESQQGEGGPAGGGEGNPGAPIVSTGRPDVDDGLRRSVTKRSRPGSGSGQAG